MNSVRFSIAATFTAEPLRAVMSFWSRQLDVPFEIEFARFNQVAQTLLEPGGLFTTNAHGANVILLRADDLGDRRALSDNAAQLGRTIAAAAQRCPSPFLVYVCPSVADAGPLITGLRSGLSGARSVRVVTADEVAARYPVAEPFDTAAERLAGIPYTELYFAALGTAIVRETVARLMPPYKAIALDCDNTLWKGICGEEGAFGIELDEPRRALQERMLEQRDAGMLLCLASKNNESDVLEVFRERTEMPLHLEHFTATRLNWNPKAESLASLAAELNIGLDSFIFIDDNAKECAEVREQAPEVLTLALPADEARIPQFLEHCWAFDHPAITEEDRRRNLSYAQAQEFGRQIRAAETLQHFMATLRLDVRVAPLTEERIARAAQLTRRTNQFNFTTIRRNENEIVALHEVLAVDVSDRFGDYGFTGLVIAAPEHETLRIDTFLLSCRVLGRGVEHRVMRSLGELAVQRGLRSITAELHITEKNMPALQFLESIGAEQRTPIEGGFRFVLPASEMARLEWKPAAPGAQTHATPRPQAPPRRHTLVDFGYIAEHLSTPEDILHAMRQVGAPEQSAVVFATDTERELARIWANLLERAEVRPGDNFFDLGGHSLLAVLLIMRVRETFGVELAVDDVYSGSLTLSKLAEKIESLQLANTSPEEYEAMLAEIESLSDEEVARLLLEAEQGTGEARGA